MAVVLVMHLNKAAQQLKAAVYRLSGSMAFAALARSVLAVTHDKQDRQRRLITCVKVNNAEAPKGLAFAIRDRDGVPVVGWEREPVDISADEALAGEQEKSNRSKAVEEAEEFARNVLARGPVQSRTLFAAAEVADIAESTLRRTLRQIGADTHRPKGVKNPQWEWSLAPQKSGDAAGECPGTAPGGPSTTSPNNNRDQVDEVDQHDQHVEQGRLDRLDRVDRVLRVEHAGDGLDSSPGGGSRSARRSALMDGPLGSMDGDGSEQE